MLVLLAGFWTHLIPLPFLSNKNQTPKYRVYLTLFISGRTNKIPIISRTYSSPGSKERRKEEKGKRTEKKEYQRKKQKSEIFLLVTKTEAHSSKKAAFCRSACFL
jgi:hypothetical protein